MAGIGAMGAVYGRLKDAPTIGGIGSAVFFVSVVLYYFERYRMMKRASGERREETQRKIDDA